MGNIQVLSFEVANLIAAGEVVDRPASAIKEMMENAIDAGAKHVTVEIQNGGVSFMRVTDDGCGMSEEDLPMSIRRHATSKIRDAADLDGILTLGFRGEALAAISSVSDMRIMSKRREDPVGHMLEVRGGTIVGVTEYGCREGTTVIVEHLFANVPARRKFLKRDVTEAMAVSANVERVALSHPEIAVRLIVDGSPRLDTAGDGKLLSAIYAVCGRDFAQRLCPVQAEHEGICVQGFIGRSDNVKANRNGQNFFINHRYIKSRTAQAALEEAYVSYLPPEKYPVCVLNIQLNPARVDVNVHPAKLEVKFSNEKPVFEAVYYAVRQSLEQNTTRPEFDRNAFKPAFGGGRVSDRTTPIETERPESLKKRQIGMAVPVAGQETAHVGRPPAPESVPAGQKNGQKPGQQPGQKPVQEHITAEQYLSWYINKDKKGRDTSSAPRAQTRNAPPADPPPAAPVPPADSAVPDPNPGMTVEPIPMEVYEAEAQRLFGQGGDIPLPPIPEEPNPAEPVPAAPLPSDAVPVAPPPSDAVPADPLPADSLPADPLPVDPPPVAPSAAMTDASADAQPVSSASAEVSPQTPYRIIGEAFRSYVIVERGEKLLLIDKHAAHERIIFEQLKARLKEKTVDSQLLLLPIEVMLMSDEVGLIDAYRDELEAIGFTFTCLRNTVRVESIPGGIPSGAVPDMFATFAQQFRSGAGSAKLTRDILFEKALFQASCKAAIKAGRDYPPEQVAWVVDQLMKIPDITFCPHGRPVAMEITKHGLDHQFERC